MPKKVKLSLNQLEVTSFATDLLGGNGDKTNIDKLNNSIKHPVTYGCNVTHPQLCTGNPLEVCIVL